MSEDISFQTQPTHHTVRHYYGDFVRVLFVLSAVILLFVGFERSLGIPLPITIVFLLLLVFSAGVTNPKLAIIQWFNVIVAAGALLFFGTLAFTRFDSLAAFLSRGFLLALLDLALIGSLYFATATLRGFLLRGKPDLPTEAGAGHLQD